jgi:large subunit ribosomal protein L21
MLDNSGKIVLGNPVVKGASVEAKIVKHLKDDKVIVFKKKRRKGYKVKNGHRQYLTKLEILAIDAKAPAAKKTPPKKVAKPDAEKAPAKKTVAKKAPAKKTTAKKAE